MWKMLLLIILFFLTVSHVRMGSLGVHDTCIPSLESLPFLQDLCSVIDSQPCPRPPSGGTNFLIFSKALNNSNITNDGSCGTLLAQLHAAFSCVRQEYLPGVYRTSDGRLILSICEELCSTFVKTCNSSMTPAQFCSMIADGAYGVFAYQRFIPGGQCISQPLLDKAFPTDDMLIIWPKIVKIKGKIKFFNILYDFLACFPFALIMAVILATAVQLRFRRRFTNRDKHVAYSAYNEIEMDF